MAIEVVTREDLEIFRLRLLDDLKKSLQPVQPSRKEWLKGNEVRKLLKISPGTLQSLRINGSLRPTKLGGILYYRYDEIENLLEGQDKDHR
jgi:hypothetical protein